MSCIFANIKPHPSALTSVCLKPANNSPLLMSAKKITLVLVFVSLLLTGMGQGNTQTVTVSDAFAQNQRLGRGVNILGYDPIWRSRDRARFKAEYFQKLKVAGFNSVRINLHAFRHMEATNGWTLKSSWLEVLDWAVKEAQ